MRITIKETDNWAVQKDDEEKVIIISYFEEFHFQDDIKITYEELGFKQN